MTREEIEQAAETLESFQKWRTGEDDRTIEDAGIVAGEVTKAIDLAIKALKGGENTTFTEMVLKELNREIKSYEDGDFKVVHFECIDKAFTTVHEDFLSAESLTK